MGVMGTLREQTLAKNREFKRQTVRQYLVTLAWQLCPPRGGVWERTTARSLSTCTLLSRSYYRSHWDACVALLLWAAGRPREPARQVRGQASR